MQNRLLSGTERIKMAQERLPIWQLLLRLSRLLHTEYLPDGNLGEDLQLIYVSMAVGIGDLEERPMSTNKIASYLGVTRRTAQRRLDRLVALGWIWRDTTGYRISRGQALSHTRHVAPAWRILTTTATRAPLMRTTVNGGINKV